MLVLGDNPKLHGSGPDKSCAKLRAFPAVGICLSPGSIMSCDALKPWGCAGIMAGHQRAGVSCPTHGSKAQLGC